MKFTKNNNYTIQELKEIGVTVGKNPRIARTVIFHTPEHINIGNNVRIDEYSVITSNVFHNTKVVIDDNVHVSAGCYLYGSSATIHMCRNVRISARTIIYTSNDNYNSSNYNLSYLDSPTCRKCTVGNVYIGIGAIIGCNSTILPNVKIGSGVSIGSYSLIKENCLSKDGIYVGIPVKLKN